MKLKRFTCSAISPSIWINDTNKFMSYCCCCFFSCHLKTLATMGTLETPPTSSSSVTTAEGNTSWMTMHPFLSLLPDNRLQASREATLAFRKFNIHQTYYLRSWSSMSSEVIPLLLTRANSFPVLTSSSAYLWCWNSLGNIQGGSCPLCLEVRSCTNIAASLLVDLLAQVHCNW